MKGNLSRKILFLALSIVLAVGLMGTESLGRTFVVSLTGAAEAPGPGDPDGSGTATIVLSRGQEEICYHIAVSNIALPATGAHIHVGPAGSPGPVVVPLAAPGLDGHSSGCVAVDRELVKAIDKNPEAYYVNVHSTEFRAGAVRGQLSD